MKIIDKLIINDKPPEYKTVVWIDTSDNCISKIWYSGEWKPISGIINPDGSSIIPYDDIPALNSTTGSAGNSFKYSRGDHRHPSDTSKVDKVYGKGLSTYDYDKTAKDKVDAIPDNPQYTDTTYTAGDGISIEGNVISATGDGGGGEENVIESISVNGAAQTVTNKNVDIAVPTKTSDLNNDSGFITGYTETDPTVPSWAKQSSKPSYDYSEIGNTPTIPTVPTNVSAFNNDAGYLTSHQDISGKENTSNKVTSFQSTPDDTHYPSEKLVKDSLDVKQNTIDASHKLSADYIQDGTTNKVINVKPDWNAASGADAEILNKPTIPAAGIPSGGNAGQILKKVSSTEYDVTWANLSETLPSAYCTTSGSTAAKKANCSLYVTQANLYLQVLIGSANTYQGALTLNINSAGAKPIYINDTVSSSTNYTLPNGTYFVFYDGTNYYFRTDGKIQGPDGILYNIPSTGIPASDLANGVIPDTSGLTPKITITNHGTNDTTFTLTPNVFHIWGQVSSLTLTLDTVSTTYLDEFMFQFESGSTATTLNLPVTVKVIGTVEANKTYQCSIVNNIAVLGGVS